MSGRIVDLILALVAIEALALLAWRRWTGRGPSTAPLLANLLSGAALMVALRAALTDAHWTTIAACLSVALICHLADLVPRLREAARPPRAGGRDSFARGKPASARNGDVECGRTVLKSG